MKTRRNKYLLLEVRKEGGCGWGWDRLPIKQVFAPSQPHNPSSLLWMYFCISYFMLISPSSFMRCCLLFLFRKRQVVNLLRPCRLLSSVGPHLKRIERKHLSGSNERQKWRYSEGEIKKGCGYLKENVLKECIDVTVVHQNHSMGEFFINES